MDLKHLAEVENLGREERKKNNSFFSDRWTLIYSFILKIIVNFQTKLVWLEFCEITI